MEFLWAVYLTTCLNGQCYTQEIHRYDPPMAQYKCERLLEVYASIPADGNWDTIEWVCKPLNSEGI